MPVLQELLNFQNIPEDLKAESDILINRALAQSHESSDPHFVHLCGIPGSGKSSYAKKRLSKSPELNLVSFDAIMHELSGYRLDATSNLKRAFQKWEIPARTIGYHLLNSLIQHNRNVLFDHSAAFEEHLLLIQHLRQLGYSLEMVYLECSPELALQRVRARQKNTLQYTPEEIVWQRYELLQVLTPRYRELVDEFHSIDANSGFSE